MSLLLGNTLIAGVATNTISNAHSLLDYKWTDHILNEMSWLRSDTFSWQSGDVYTGVYNHLVADIDGKSSSTETIGSYTITYYLANDGHKIVLPNMVTTIQNIYNATGSAWYYILDTDNKRFKLPRSSHGDVVERYKSGTNWYRIYSDGWCEQGGHSSSSGGQTIQLHKEMADVNYDVVSSGTIFYTNTAKTTTSFTCSGSAWGTAQVAYLDWCVYGYVASYPANSQYKYLYFYAGNYDVSNITNVEVLNSKANIDMDNLTNAGKNITNWSNNMTNCLIETPQNIKLELSSGTLTLKAGSKVYIPDGFEQDGTTKKFNVVNIENDLTYSTAANGVCFLVYSPSTGLIGRAPVSTATSGGTQPSSPSSLQLWYDTTNNKIYRYDSAWEQHSFPLAIMTISNSAISSIDQIFNWIGYIGNTFFTLPGIKGLYPNGRNSDGTMNNTSFITNSVLTNSISSNGYVHIRLRHNNLQSGDLKYNKEFNYNYLNEYTDSNKRFFAIVGTLEVQSGSITSINPKQSFCSLDYNDKGTIAGWGMPSRRYIDLTLGATGSYYTAPANGWLILKKQSGASDKYLQCQVFKNSVVVTDFILQSSYSGQAGFTIPMAKGSVANIYYSFTGDTSMFRFVYAEGEV